MALLAAHSTLAWSLQAGAAPTSSSASTIFSNPWVIGLITGLLSGIILSLITPVILRRRRTRDIEVRRDRSAEDVLSTLRPSVATGNFPSAQMVEAARRAAAFNRGLNIKYAVPASDLLDVLMSEVLGSSFVAPESRIGIAEQLLAMQADLGATQHVPITADDIKAPDRATIAAFAGLGAIIIGVASAVSVITGNATPLIVTAVLTFIALPILQMGPRVSHFSLGFGNIKLQVRRSPDPPANKPDVLI